jgi:hypothetical protein
MRDVSAGGYPLASPLAPLRRPAAADPAADLYDRHGARVYRFCRRFADGDAAEDATHATLIAALAARRTGIDADADPGWLFELATGICRAGAYAAPPSFRALALLPRDLARPLRQRACGHSYAQIADTLGVPRREAERRVFLARAAAARPGSWSASSLLSLVKSFGATKVAAVAALAATTATVPVVVAHQSRRPPHAPAPTPARVPAKAPAHVAPLRALTPAAVATPFHPAPKARIHARPAVAPPASTTASPTAPTPAAQESPPAREQATPTPAAGAPSSSPSPAAAAPEPASPAAPAAAPADTAVPALPPASVPDAPVAAVTEPQPVAAVVQAVEPVVQAVEPVVQTVEPVVQAVQPVVQAVSTATQAALPPLGGVPVKNP